MNTDESSKRLDVIEKRLSAVEDKKKDVWDKFNIVASLLIPIAIGVAGYYVSYAQIASAVKEGEQNRTVALINARVEQAKLVSTFIEPLVSDSPQKRKISIKAIAFGLGNAGREVVEEVAKTDPDADVKQYASAELTALDARRLQLIKNLFADIPQIRIAAADELLQGWHSDPKLIPILIDVANQNKNNADGIYNAVVILNGVDISALLANRDIVMSFLTTAESNGSKTKNLVDQVRAKISG